MYGSADPAVGASEDDIASVEAAEAEDSRPAGDEGTPWIKRYAPTRNSVEFGVYGGVFIPSARHELYVPIEGAVNMGHQPFATVAPDFGARFGYYPLRWLGFELGGGAMPTKTEDGSSATVFAFRAWGILQAPYRIAPFARLGFGLLGSSSLAIGDDIDPAFHFGGGVKFYVNRWFGLRLDVVDNVTTAVGISDGRSHNIEVLLGLIFRFGGKSPEKLVDSDGDGLYDPGQKGVSPENTDRCPYEPGPRENQGCPLPLVDTDGDGLFDPNQDGIAPEDTDACPLKPGLRENRGCPLVDTDGDGLYDPGQSTVPEDMIDRCPTTPGPRANQGCPWPDTDGDGILDNVDQCPNEPETYNGIHDHDGCPDAVPDEIKAIEVLGIQFEVDSATIRKRSYRTLDRAVQTLNQFPELNFEIAGHTDSDGSEKHNQSLSERRAASVRDYMVDHGINPARLTTVGFGESKPIDTNETRAGKARNRRIEFHVTAGAAPVTTAPSDEGL